MLKIYNTMTQQKETFVPIHVGKVGIYVCGITVYDYCHIGHARVMVSFDVITRYLRHLGYKVKYVRNITDIDDKIIKRSQENNEETQALTKRFITAMHDDFTALGIMEPDEEPRATAHIDEIIKMTQQLIDNNHAYVAKNGDVYYDVTCFADYGKLSHRVTEELQAGARVNIIEEKRNPLDFVLWKVAKPGEPHWESPWGAGRPGWHIECSAMSTSCLGEHFDIHGGGFDLIFPHHENEIAQSEAATQQPFVNYWMHVGYLQIDEEKMSKSLGNFFTIRQVLESYPPEVVRFFLLSSHYRSPLNYSELTLDNAHDALKRFYIALRDLKIPEKHETNEYITRFHEAMNDDFNVPEALAVMFELTREINRLRTENQEEKAGEYAASLKSLGKILGVLQMKPEAFLQEGSHEDLREIKRLIAAREQARQQRNWDEADRLREELKAMHVEVEDQAEGTRWRRE